MICWPSSMPGAGHALRAFAGEVGHGAWEPSHLDSTRGHPSTIDDHPWFRIIILKTNYIALGFLLWDDIPTNHVLFIHLKLQGSMMHSKHDQKNIMLSHALFHIMCDRNPFWFMRPWDLIYIYIVSYHSWSKYMVVPDNATYLNEKWSS